MLLVDESAISIHAPTWGATQLDLNLLKRVPYFNPRTHVGCDAEKSFLCMCGLKFQSTHPRGVRPTIWNGIFILFRFQSTHPRGVRPPLRIITTSTVQFQSTHPRGVRPMAFRSATRRRYFNPRTHVGCDGTSTSTVSLIFRFQSTHPRGVRPLSYRLLTDRQRFQSTHPRGVRHKLAEIYDRLWNFNPRTHVGCDLSHSAQSGCDCLFQSTHPRGVRPKRFRLRGRHGYFNPRTHVGCDQKRLIHPPLSPYFNPRTHVGCDFFGRCCSFIA